MASATARNFLRAGKKVRLHQLTPPITYLFPQIVAIGRNYAEHVKEFNNATPTEPFFFLKPTTSYLPSGGTLEIPRGIIAHHEGTLAINSSCLPSPLNAHSRTRPHHIKTWPGHPPLRRQLLHRRLYPRRRHDRTQPPIQSQIPRPPMVRSKRLRRVHTHQHHLPSQRRRERPDRSQTYSRGEQRAQAGWENKGYDLRNSEAARACFVDYDTRGTVRFFLSTLY